MQTLGRQYRPTRVITGSRTSARLVSNGRWIVPNSVGGFSVPDHDLDPPKFAHRALETLLGDWATVKSMILTVYRAPPETFKGDASSKTSSSLGANNGGENTGGGW